MTKFLNISTDTTLGGNAPSDELAVSQKAIKTYVDNHGGGSGLPDQTGHAGEFLTTDGTDASWSDTIGYHPDLFDVKWADHILNDVQWLRADTFSWQAGSVYQAAYQHLADDITGKTLQSETISGTTIQFYLADDGHKICPASEESNVVSVYNATGVAWYYILDTVNQRFKLPRTKFGFTGIRSGVGGFVNAGLPNITGQVSGANAYGKYAGFQDATGAFYADDNGSVVESGASGSKARTLHIDASRSSSIYGNSNTVQPKATEMYLYFYVGQFTQTALENTAGVVTEDFNELNAHKVIAFQEPTSANNWTWYRKYADGWVEQGGNATLPQQSANTSASATLNLPIAMQNSNYSVVENRIADGGSSYELTQIGVRRTVANCSVLYFSTVATSGPSVVNMVISGMAAN